MDATIAKNKNIPTYRRRKGYSQAIVTLTDAVTLKRKDYWLGEYGTPGSHEMYHRVLADWESCGRRFPAVVKNSDGGTIGTTISELTQGYWKHASSYYSPAAAGHIKTLIRLVCHHFGCSSATSFGPNDLRLVREAMIKGDLTADLARKPWSRCYVNS